jgi:hypothetical protein
MNSHEEFGCSVVSIGVVWTTEVGTGGVACRMVTALLPFPGQLVSDWSPIEHSGASDRVMPKLSCEGWVMSTATWSSVGGWPEFLSNRTAQCAASRAALVVAIL